MQKMFQFENQQRNGLVRRSKNTSDMNWFTKLDSTGPNGDSNYRFL